MNGLTAIVPLCLSFSLPVLAGCAGHGDLTREEVKQIINEAPLFTPGQSIKHDLDMAITGLPEAKPCAWQSGENRFPREVVEVTGIATEDANLRRVEFKWHWQRSKASPAAAKCLPDLGPIRGTAILQRYDDGWRVVQVDAKGL